MAFTLSFHLHTINCKLKMNVYWTHGVSMCGHVRTLFHRYDTLLVPCVCSSDASRIHDYGMPFHRFHSRIQQQDGITLQPIVYFPLSIRALKKRQSENEYTWQIHLTKISILMQVLWVRYASMQYEWHFRDYDDKNGKNDKHKHM
jgi:hypothetical protein